MWQIKSHYVSMKFSEFKVKGDAIESREAAGYEGQNPLGKCNIMSPISSS